MISFRRKEGIIFSESDLNKAEKMWYNRNNKHYDL